VNAHLKPGGDARCPGEAAAIKENFRSWVFADLIVARSSFACTTTISITCVPACFDGSHLEFPGMNRTIILQPHQKDAVWRGMSSGIRCWPMWSAVADLHHGREPA